MQRTTRTAVAGSIILLPFVAILVAGSIVRTRDSRELRAKSRKLRSSARSGRASAR
jgi:hypothetical protein